MTREEAIQALDRLMQQCSESCGDHDGVTLETLRTYIFDSIPTPTVEVETDRIYDKDVMVNKRGILSGGTCRQVADNLRAALGIEVRP